MLTLFRNQQYLYGYKDEAGKIIIAAIYEEAGEFTDGVAAVAQREQWGLIDEAGQVLIPLAYQRVYPSCRGWVHACKQDTRYLFTQAGKLVLQVQDILYWHYPEEGIIRVKKPSGWGCLNQQGETVIPFNYKSLGPSRNGWISYVDNNQWGWLDHKGHELVPARFDEVQLWNKDLWWARKNGYYTLYDFSGRLIRQEGWSRIIKPRQGMAAVKTADGWKYIREDFSTILQLPPVYEWVELFQEGLAAVKRNGLWGFINTRGEEVVPALFARVQAFSEGLAAVQVAKDRVDQEWGYINEKGEIMIPCQFYGAGPFLHGKARVHDSYYYYAWYINKKGESLPGKETLEY